MSALGQKLPRRGQVAVSALPPKAAAVVADRRVRFGPKADIEPSFDHLVSDGEQPWRHLNIQRSRGLKVDGEHELGRLQYRQIGGLCAFKDAAGIDADLTKRIRDIGPVAH